ncbi:MAG: hypothetical protein U1E17_05845 [Geminicoccaceae bacterium]
MLQPATKALAQMLAGNTKVSGQLVHARNVLAQANRLVEERMADRLPPAAREDFLEQLARLKLTIADAEDAGLEPDPETEVQVRPVAELGVDRLREVALRLAAASATSSQPVRPPIVRVEEEDEPPVPPAGHEGDQAGALLRRPAATQVFRPEESASHTGPRRERLRLKPAGRSSGPDAEG